MCMCMREYSTDSSVNITTSEGERSELVKDMIAGRGDVRGDDEVAFGWCLDECEETPVTVSYDKLNHGTLIAGGNGVGRTDMLVSVFEQTSYDGFGSFFISTMSSTSERIQDVIPERRSEDVFTVGGDAAQTKTIDVFETPTGVHETEAKQQTIELVVDFLTSSAEGVTTRHVAEEFARLGVENESIGFNDICIAIHEFVDDDTSVTSIPSESMKRVKHVAGGSIETVFKELKESIGDVSPVIMRDMFSNDNVISLHDAIAGNKIVVFDLAEYPQTVHGLTNLILKKIHQTRSVLSGRTRPDPVFVFADDVRTIQYSTAELISSEAQTYRLPLVLSVKNISQMGAVKSVLIDSLANTVVFRNDDVADAEKLTSVVGSNVHDLHELPRYVAETRLHEGKKQREETVLTFPLSSSSGED